jgi:hypothetical protein
MGITADLTSRIGIVVNAHQGSADAPRENGEGQQVDGQEQDGVDGPQVGLGRQSVVDNSEEGNCEPIGKRTGRI